MKSSIHYVLGLLVLVYVIYMVKENHTGFTLMKIVLVSFHESIQLVY